MNMENALTIRAKYLPANTAALQAVTEHTQAVYELVRSGDNSPLTAIATANALQALREALTPEVLHNLRKLQGSPLGFLTDRDKGEKLDRGKYAPGSAYDDATLADVVIFAASRGARMTGNEVNIIKGKGYLTKNYYARLNDDTIGRNCWWCLPDIPQMQTGGAICSGKVWWKDDAGEHVQSLKILIRGYPDSTTDFYVGKWEARARRFIYERSTGNPAPENDGELPEEVIDTTAEEVKAEMSEAMAETPITKEEATELLMEARSKGLNKEELGYIVWTKFGCQNSAEIRRGDLAAIRKAIRAAVPGQVIKEGAE